MISRFSYGHVIETEAILQKPAAENGALPFLSVDEASLSLTYSMDDNDKVYGLGEMSAASTSAAGFTRANAPMNRNIWRTDVPSTALTTSLW